jgi:hypothetical protein
MEHREGTHEKASLSTGIETSFLFEVPIPYPLISLDYGSRLMMDTERF